MTQTQGNTKLARQLLWCAAYVNVALLCAICSLTMMSPSCLYSLLLLAVADFAVCFYAIDQGLFFELRQERIWKAVCAGVGFSAEGRSFRNGLYGAYVKGETKTIYPELRDVHGTYQEWTGMVTPFAGQTVADFTKEAVAFAEAFHVPYINFSLADNGLIATRAGRVAVPEVYEYTPLPILSDDARDRLQAVPMAQTLDGRTWSMPIEGQHLLVAGRTGSGKSSWIWGLVFGVEPAINAGACRIWAIDPKKVELAIGKHWFYKYANDPASMVALIEEFLHEMQVRGDAMHGVIRKFTPSTDTPLNILLIDELAYMTSLLPDKKLRDRAMAALTTILTQGRAIGYSCVGAIQDPRKESLPNRDSFPIRVALGLAEKQLVDMVLGDGAHDKNALCEQIPLGAAGAGVGYVISEENNQPLCVRAAWCSDEAIKRKLGAPAEALLETPPLVYPAYEQGYVPQLDFNNQPFNQSSYRDGE